MQKGMRLGEKIAHYRDRESCGFSLSEMPPKRGQVKVSMQHSEVKKLGEKMNCNQRPRIAQDGNAGN